MQLPHTQKSGKRDSNPRPSAWEALFSASKILYIKYLFYIQK